MTDKSKQGLSKDHDRKKNNLMIQTADDKPHIQSGTRHIYKTRKMRESQELTLREYL